MLKKTGSILLILLLAACADAPPPDPVEPPADAVATWDGGAAGLAEIESAFATTRIPVCRRARRAGRLEQLVKCYRELAEGSALEALVMAEVDDLESALEALGEDGEDPPTLRRQVYRDVYLRRLRAEIEITDAAVEARFRADPERYRTPAELNLSNIFRRHRDPDHPEETDEFLRGLKQRFLAGETFAALAREYSHSETKLRGGEVGQVAESDLAPRLREIVFALGDGEVSDPVPVEGGAVLLYVQGVRAGSEPALDRARRQIRRELRAERIGQTISERVARREPPAGSRILDLDELVAALDGDPEAVMLEIAGERLLAGQLRRLAGIRPRDAAADLDDEGRDELAELYHRQRELFLLALELVESAEPALREEAEEQLRRLAITRLVDERVTDEMGRLVDAEIGELRTYFDDNRHHYQSPLRFQLRLWDLPFDDDPTAQLRRMETLRERLAAGEIDLADAAAELGGSVRDLGWQEFDELDDELPGKARTYLMEAGDSGWSVPYQQDDMLHLIRLDEREEPRQLSYEEAAERVRADYLQRFEQDLYRRVVDDWLGGAGFAFDEDAVRRLLTPEGVETESSEAPAEE